ncbi:MAG TPA: DUF2007 domain-containing protein [Gemmataceae bacterium]|jgi:hypothetical protein|nr:DUF2007 domain-containing protein [Gemmataceae bacterium]
MDMVTVARYDRVAEARLAKNLLDAEGIPAFLDGDAASDMLHLTSEVKLQVAEEHATEARELLQAAERHQLAEETEKEADATAQAEGESPAEI